MDIKLLAIEQFTKMELQPLPVHQIVQDTLILALLPHGRIAVLQPIVQMQAELGVSQLIYAIIQDQLLQTVILELVQPAV